MRGKLTPQLTNRDHLTILMFHRCLPKAQRESFPFPGLVITPEDLDWLLRLLLPLFDVRTVSDAASRLARDEPVSKPLLALSFDDGQWDNLAYAHPVLARHGVPATFYIPTQAVDEQRLIWHDRVAFASRFFAASGDANQRAAWQSQLPAGAQKLAFAPVALVESLKNISPKERGRLCEWLASQVPASEYPAWSRMMRWSEVKQLHELGHEIGSHCVTHNMLTQLEDEPLNWEISHSKSRIEAECAIPVRSLCYPNGDFDDRCVQAARSAGYTSAVSTQWGLSDAGTNVYSLRRMDVNPDAHRSFTGRLSATRTLMRFTNQFPGMGQDQ